MIVFFPEIGLIKKTYETFFWSISTIVLVSWRSRIGLLSGVDILVKVVNGHTLATLFEMEVFKFN